MKKTQHHSSLKPIFLGFFLIASCTAAFADSKSGNTITPPCPRQFTQGCTFTDDILVNRHYAAKDHYHHNGNGETNYYLSSQVISDPTLSLLTLSTKAVPADKSYNCNEGGICKYISGWIDTQGKWSTAGIKHGYVEVNAEMPVSPGGENPDYRYKGMWPAIWMLPNDEGAGWPTHGEIDISELHGADCSDSGTTLHYGDPKNPGHTAYDDGTFAQNPATAYDASSYGKYHTYGLEWNFNSNDPYLATWYDGNLVAKRHLNVSDKRTHSYNLYSDIFLPGQAKGYYLILNIATGGAFGPTDDTATSKGSGLDSADPLLQMNISSIKSWKFED